MPVRYSPPISLLPVPGIALGPAAGKIKKDGKGYVFEPVKAA